METVRKNKNVKLDNDLEEKDQGISNSILVLRNI